jgi:hypothetical protein
MKKLFPRKIYRQVIKVCDRRLFAQVGSGCTHNETQGLEYIFILEIQFYAYFYMFVIMWQSVQTT